MALFLMILVSILVTAAVNVVAVAWEWPGWATWAVLIPTWILIGLVFA